MNARLLSALALVAAMVTLADTTFIIGTSAAVGTVAVAPAAIAAAGVAAAALGGLVLGAVAINAKGRRRGKRETAACLPSENPELYFSLSANGDFLDCGRRFVCELEATRDENLAEEELLIRDVFARGASLINGTAGNFYREAGLLGTQDGLVACAQAFSKCPFDRKTIFLAYQDARKA